MPATRLTLASVLALVLGGPVARAQVLHERVAVTPEAAGPEPADGEPIYSPQPEAPVEAGGPSATSAPGDRPPERRDVIRPDRQTGPEPPGTHVYHAVFDPSPFPYKRMTALDAARIVPCEPPAPAGCEDEVLEVRDPTLRPVPVGARPLPGRAQFRGSIVIDFEPGRWVPIPSVAAEIRVLSVETEPPIDVALARDSADNYFVRSPAGGRHRLTWVSDAPMSYFGGELPAGVRLGDEPRALLPPLPARIRRRAARVLAHIGVHPSPHASLASVLDPLVGYFRSFQLGELPPATKSTYCDLALGQKGCCRHRSYAFTITAIAAGIPARYVENEVHVFVEVYLPRLGWRRVNLGGAPVDETIAGGEGKARFQPPVEDPFPEPAPFLSTSAPPPKGIDAFSPPESEGAPSGGTSGSSSSEATSGGSSSEATSGGSSGGRHRIDLDAIERADEASVHAEAARPPAERRAPTSITVALSTRSSFRGDTVEVTGQVRSGGAGAGGLPVEIYLGAPGGAVKVAEVATAPDGRYHASVEVPRDLELGDHRVIARTRGDDRHAPSSTR